MTFGAKALPPLGLGDVVTVQDQSDPRKAGKWTKTGTVVKIMPVGLLLTHPPPPKAIGHLIFQHLATDLKPHHFFITHLE